MKKQNNQMQVKLISPQAEEALKELVEKGYIEIIGLNKDSIAKQDLQKSAQKKSGPPLNFAKSSNEEILKRMNLKGCSTDSLSQARNIINFTRGDNKDSSQIKE